MDTVKLFWRFLAAAGTENLSRSYFSALGSVTNNTHGTDFQKKEKMKFTLTHVCMQNLGCSLPPNATASVLAFQKLSQFVTYFEGGVPLRFLTSRRSVLCALPRAFLLISRLAIAFILYSRATLTSAASFDRITAPEICIEL